jgi:hypothetical protein
MINIVLSCRTQLELSSFILIRSAIALSKDALLRGFDFYTNGYKLSGNGKERKEGKTYEARRAWNGSGRARDFLVMSGIRVPNHRRERKKDNKGETRTYHVPQPRHTQVAPRAVDHTLLVQRPDLLAFVTDGVTADLAHAVTRIAKSNEETTSFISISWDWGRSLSRR